MNELAKELMVIEDKAAAFYHAMAVYFQNDSSIAVALDNFAKDEQSHSEILKVVPVIVPEGSEMSFPLESVRLTQAAICNSMDICLAKAQAGNLTLRGFGETLTDIEFSEWNSLFFYVINTYKDVSHECRMAAIQLQGHIRRIYQFLDKLPLDKDVLARLRNLPPLWTENILVIDDTESVRELLKSVLCMMGKVDVASDGVEGLEKIRRQYYALIVSDIVMPGCNGIELFQKAYQLFPTIGKRFLFFSGQVSEDQVSFIRHHNLELMSKPANLREIRTKASAFLTVSGATNHGGSWQ